VHTGVAASLWRSRAVSCRRRRFVERFQKHGPISQLPPTKADEGLTFRPDHPDEEEALRWMGFEAREAILETLERAVPVTGTTAVA
jgi:hypothetical protein